MTRAYHIAKAALWGAVGPGSVGLVLAGYWGTYSYHGAPLNDFVLSLVENVFQSSRLLLFEVTFGLIYGGLRCALWPKPDVHGICLGVGFFALVGFSILLDIRVANQMLLGLANYGMDNAMRPLILCFLAHIAGGAIAGYQVDVHLQSAKRSES